MFHFFNQCRTYRRNMADLFHNLTIENDISDVYHAFSDPEELNKWWTKESSGKASEGEFYRMFFGVPHDWRFKVTIAQLPSRFEWQVVQADPDWKDTRLGVQLSEDDKGTSVAFYHTGWPEENEHFKHSNFCWALLLNGLKQYLEKGTITPFEERA